MAGTGSQRWNHNGNNDQERSEHGSISLPAVRSYADNLNCQKASRCRNTPCRLARNDAVGSDRHEVKPWPIFGGEPRGNSGTQIK